MQDIIFTPSDLIASLNQTLEFAYPQVVIEGELSNFKVSKNRWVYFDLKDELASVRFFGTVYQLPGPLEDGLTVRVVGAPRMHSHFGFSVNLSSITPVGEGSFKKAANLLQQKLEAEGLFAEKRKRPLPYLPTRVGLITAADSAAAADFKKILNERWSGVEVLLIDVYVQGDQAPSSIVSAIDYFNNARDVPEVLVITRGGGSADDLAAFNDERVVRSVAASRIPTLVAIGHEVDISLAELAADKRASTPSNAVQILVPDKSREANMLKDTKSALFKRLQSSHTSLAEDLKHRSELIKRHADVFLAREFERLRAQKRFIQIFDPSAVLKRGYALISKDGKHIKSVSSIKKGDDVAVEVADGTIQASVKEVAWNG